MKVKIYHNGDDVFVAWKPDGVIAECRGFALFRRRNGVEEVVSTWVGFESDDPDSGERRASTNWPIQKYQWTDYMANTGDRVAYRVVPMVGPDKSSLRASTTEASEWTDEILLSHETDKCLQVYFNRGIVASQWVSRRLGINGSDLKTKVLKAAISTENDPLRKYLYGPLGDKLFEVLAEASKKGREIYAALYELDDDQLEGALESFGKNAHVVLANASAKSKTDDPNAEARQRLEGKINLYDRMTAPRALAHNKFLVICDGGKPRWVWTGSQNWTRTGLCTQANNSVLIDDQAVATEYKNQWEELRESGDDSPQELKEKNSTSRKLGSVSKASRVWFTPTIDEVDLEEARAAISGAKSAILFLMFNPGPRGTLLNTIIETARSGESGSRLYIRGVLNQDPSTDQNPVEIFSGKNSEKADFSIVLPAAIDESTKWFRRQMKKLQGTFAMVHSKVIVVDPFGPDPVVLTGSHNLGPKASKTNDENLLILRGLGGAAAAYATNIMAIYNQYRWQYRRHLQPENRRWKGLVDSDEWQAGYLKAGSSAKREMDFWVGE